VFPTHPRRLPRDAVAPGLEVDDGGKRVRRERSVLLLAELPIFQRTRMKERGALITRVQNVPEAVTALADNDFDAAIIDMKAPGDGAALVKSIKAGVGSTEPIARMLETQIAELKAALKALAEAGEPSTDLSATLEAMEAARRDSGARTAGVEERARQRHSLTPFFLVMENEQQYAIVVNAPEQPYLEDGKGLSLPDAVMCLDVGKLLVRGAARA
jgi:hypothetical protein